MFIIELERPQNLPVRRFPQRFSDLLYYRIRYMAYISQYSHLVRYFIKVFDLLYLN